MVNVLIIQHPEQDTSYVNSIITENNTILDIPDSKDLQLNPSNGNLYHGQQNGINYLHYGPQEGGASRIYMDRRLAGLFKHNQIGGALPLETKDAKTFAELEPRIWVIIDTINNDGDLSEEDIKIWKQAFILTISDDLTATPEDILGHWWYLQVWRVNDIEQEKEDQFEAMTKGLSTNDLVQHIIAFFSFEELKACGVL